MQVIDNQQIEAIAGGTPSSPDFYDFMRTNPYMAQQILMWGADRIGGYPGYTVQRIL